ncbi:hypothetical protein ACOMHN_017359 [Nucella lapillus]
MPPTRMTSPMSDLLTSASCRAFWHGPTVRFTRGSTRDSNLDRVSFRFMCLGPLASIVRYGKLMSVCNQKQSSQFDVRLQPKTTPLI